MNLLQKYLSDPDNYIIESAGGFGKSTQLKHLCTGIRAESGSMDFAGKKQLAVYIPMNELNYMAGTPGIVFEYLKRFFSHQVTKEAIEEMIRSTQDSTDYLFVLDGMNEVNNYEIGGQTIMDFICEDVQCLLSCKNVHIVLSTRRNESIPEYLREKFKVLRFQQITNERIRAYLHLKDTDMLPGHLSNLLVNPMFLKMFGRLYSRRPELAIHITNKYELLELYYKEEIDLHKDEQEDHSLAVRKYVLDSVVPYIAFYVELGLLKKQYEEEKDLQTLTGEAFEQYPPAEEISLEAVYKMVLNTGLVSEKLQFTHEILRDYFAVKGLKMIGEAGGHEPVEAFMQNLVKWLEYRKTMKEKDLHRRTRFLDVAEFIFSSEKKRLAQTFLRYGIRPEEKRMELAQSFYQELSGVYDDLSQGKEAAEIGWIAIDYLEQIPETIPETYHSIYERAEKRNFLFYSVKWAVTLEDDDTNKRCLDYIMLAKEKLEGIPLEYRDAKINDLYGRVLSNIGAYYYKIGSEERKRNRKQESYKTFAEAECWHLQAMEYKKQYCTVSAVVRSYETLMQDAYWQGDPLKGYEYFKFAWCEMYPDRTVEDCLLFEDYNKFPEEFVERVLGNEQQLLVQDFPEELKEEITEQISAQVEYVFNAATGHARNNMKLIQSLYQKLQIFADCEWIKKQKKVFGVVEEYQKKCKSLL